MAVELYLLQKAVKMSVNVQQSRVRYRSFHYTGETLDEMLGALSFYFGPDDALYWWVDQQGYFLISAVRPNEACDRGNVARVADAAMRWLDGLDYMAKRRLNHGIPNEESIFTALDGFSLESNFRWRHEDPDNLKITPAWV